MNKPKVTLSWVGIVVLGLAHGVLEDLMFILVLVEYAPPSLDLTGNVFFVFTVPLAQLMTFAITGTIAWHLLRLKERPKLMIFWLCWIGARATFLTLAQNPIGDIMIYLGWITFWCLLVGLRARAQNSAEQPAE
jgi:hypothetical protein